VEERSRGLHSTRGAIVAAITGYRAQLGDAAAEVLRHLSRDLDCEACSRQKEDAPNVALRRSAE
jgi:biopolymer transport protein ExbB